MCKIKTKNTDLNMVLSISERFPKYPFFDPYEWRFQLVVFFSVAMESITLDSHKQIDSGRQSEQ